MFKMKRVIKFIFLINTFVFYFFMCLHGQGTAQISIPFEVYDDAGGHYTLYFGLDQSATDGIDTNLGEMELPPYPPMGVFEARWFLPENNFNGILSSWNDYRYAPGFPYTGTKEHRVRYQSNAGATIIYFSWNLPPEVTGLLQDVIDGTHVNIPVSGNGVYGLTNFTFINPMKLLVYYNNIVTNIEDEEIKPLTYSLEQNYPNPFNPATNIEFSLSEEVEVSLSIFNELGQKVTELVNTKLEAGKYSYQWDAKNASSGIYFYELKTEKFVEIKKMILIQ